MNANSIAIMQPYFCPYVGYFQLIRSVDSFVIYDNIKYTKRGWINRNRFLQDGKDQIFSLPLRKASDYEYVCNRYLADNFESQRKKIIAQFSNAYRKAPYFSRTMDLVNEVFMCEERNLFGFVFHSVQVICDVLSIRTPITISSSLGLDHSLAGDERVLSICKHLGATTYINTAGGTGLYDRERFSGFGINLLFLESDKLAYRQFGNDFVPRLSIIDLLMFNDADEIAGLLDCYTLY